MNKQNEYPKIMEVSNFYDFKDKFTRVVFMKKNGKYLAWYGAETFKEAEEMISVSLWEYAREIDPFRELKEAYKQGKTIQCVKKKNTNWVNCTCPTWDTDYDYRIKLEPEYVPFDFSDADKLIGKVVKIYKRVHLIIACEVDRVVLGSAGNNTVCGYVDLYADFKFLDGSVCGKFLN